MRYDGVLRRSQRNDPNPIDRVWNFFSSVKIAVYLILITLAGSALGTIYPQENTFINLDPSVYYKQTYGTLGQIYYVLGLSHTYDSWWFITLLFMIGTSLVICSLDRVLPLYRALTKQQIRKHHRFLTRQRVSYSGSIPAAEDGNPQAENEWIDKMAKQLRKQRYRVHIDGTALLAEKNRFSRWGPYINHIGLIVFLLAVLARSIPGWHMDQYIGFPEGRPVKIPETPYYLKNEKFIVEYYNKETLSDNLQKKDISVPKLYETDAILYECDKSCDVPGTEPVLKQVHRQQWPAGLSIRLQGNAHAAGSDAYADQSFHGGEIRLVPAPDV
jgi:cytochrome c biogenesis protein